MLGNKAKCFTPLSAVSLDALVPATNFYRKLEAKLDLAFVRELVRNHYSAMGRPSIDPVVFFKLQLIMFFEGIRSERQLMETVNLHLAHRWYIGYDLHERVPDHSSLTKIRQRYGLEVFQRFFEHIVELCIEAGLVWGKARIILAALVTPSYITDNIPMLDLQRWVRFRWHVHPKIAVGDTRYGTTANIVGLENDGIRAYVPLTDFSERNDFFVTDDFTYDAERNLYICPQEQELPLYSRRYTELVYVYRADAQICNSCPLKAKCTNSRSGRHVFRSFFYAYLDRVRDYHKTEPYKKAIRKRSIWVEPLFGEAKQWHGLIRFRLRGLHNVNIEALLIATGQNLKRLLNFKRLFTPNTPIMALVSLSTDNAKLRCNAA